MPSGTHLRVVLLGLLTLAFAPSLAGATAVSGPIISVTPASHDFGCVNVGSTSGNYDFTIWNTGGAPLHLLPPSHSVPGFSATFVDLMIPVGGSTTLTTAYTPSGSGPTADNVTISSDATNGNVIIVLSGIANNPPTFSPALAADYTATAGVPFSLTASATDPESDVLTWSLHSVPPLPAGIPGPTFASTGTLVWIPGPGDTGNYAISITVADLCASTPGSFTLRVLPPPNHAPVLAQPANMTVHECATADETISGTDSDGDALAFSLASGPTNIMTVTTTTIPPGTGNIHLAPPLGTSGTYLATVKATDPGGLSDSKSLTITVIANQLPVANLKFSTEGNIFCTGKPATFDPTGSFDPDGNIVSSTLSFGDGPFVTGLQKVTHTFTTPGNYSPQLVVTDNCGASSAVIVSDGIFVFQSHLYTAAAIGPLRRYIMGPLLFGFNKPNGFTIPEADLTPANVKLLSPGTGSVSEILASATNSGTSSFTGPYGWARFSGSSLGNLFSLLTRGRHWVTVTLEFHLSGLRGCDTVHVTYRLLVVRL